jgi:dTDP-glucose 4,6-dehydratase
MICNAMEGQSLPLYGDGLQVRDWLFVEDHCRGIMAVLDKGRDGEIYNIGGNCSLTNREVIERVLDLVGAPTTRISSVADRPGHDRRYALNSDKITRDTGFTPETSFERGLAETVAWYRQNAEWVRSVRSGSYLEYYERNYAWRRRLGAVPDAAVSTNVSGPLAIER